MKLFIDRAAKAGLAAALLLVASTAAQAQEFRGGSFPSQSGKAIYEGICQGCHMPNAMGATGAGTYPRLAGDPNLAVVGYPITMIVNGRKAMPRFGVYLSDVQIANVVNYVRTHFGNHYADKATPAEVRMARPQALAPTDTKKSLHD